MKPYPTEAEQADADHDQINVGGVNADAERKRIDSEQRQVDAEQNKINTEQANAGDKDAQRAKAERDAAVARAMLAFGTALPAGAEQAGHHHFGEAGKCPHCKGTGELIDTRAEHPEIPDGKYRMNGAEWAGRFEGGRLVEAFRCTPPLFGGDDIEIIR